MTVLTATDCRVVPISHGFDLGTAFGRGHLSRRELMSEWDRASRMYPGRGDWVEFVNGYLRGMGGEPR